MTDFCVVELPDRLDIACVESLHVELEDALGSGKSVQLKGGNVVKFDTAGIQLLQAFYAEAVKLHQQVEWVERSDTIAEVVRFLDIGPGLGLGEQEQIDA